MTYPRRLDAGRTHSATRRTTQRTYLLTPTPKVVEVVNYALGVVSERYPLVLLHAFTCESTHFHIHFTDASSGKAMSQVSDFFHDFDQIVARSLNTHYGREENFWKDGSFDSLELHDHGSLIDQYLYVVTNPVKDGLVAWPRQWPGPCYLPEDFGRPMVFKKPKHAFFGGRRPAKHLPGHPPAREARKQELIREQREAEAIIRERDRNAGLNKKERAKAKRKRDAQRRRDARRPKRDRSTLPDEATLTFVPPPGFEHLSLEEARAHFRALVNERVAQIHEERRLEGRTRFLGVDKILAQDPLADPGPTPPTFELNPRIACKDVKARIAALILLKLWRKLYKAARERWKTDKSVEFPPGTYGVRRLHGARVSTEPLVLVDGLYGKATGPPAAA